MEIVYICLKHLRPSTSTFIERIEFRKCYQNENDFTQDFDIKFKKMTSICSFTSDTLNKKFNGYFLWDSKYDNF